MTFFFQCFGVMALCQFPIFDFIVFIQKDIFVEKICFFYLFIFDKQLWEVNLLPLMKDFYFKFIMPEILKK